MPQEMLCPSAICALHGINHPAVAEYSSHLWPCCTVACLQVLQMVGRAGRPQFDTEGVAVIMTSRDSTGRYQKLLAGQVICGCQLVCTAACACRSRVWQAWPKPKASCFVS